MKIPKSTTAATFANLLRTKLIPLMNDAKDGDGDGFVFMQDGNGTQTAKIVQNCLSDEGIDQLAPWPAHSPDLNPIENAWAIVERPL